ncbi:Hypothetical protein GSB_152012 [Giardia duodenalis]|uniref:Uncharacterized protein n=1 Tax=Giardia intestinalis TaxID=5741 RepID=V6TZ82_GIAIN|nr:Hypothetical protein GSB_152012 [Giardia intestinalis]
MNLVDHRAPRRERQQPEFTTRIGDRPPSYRAENDPHLKTFFSNPNNARIVEMAKTTERGVSQAGLARIHSKHLEGATMANTRSRSNARPSQKSPTNDGKSLHKSTRNNHGSPTASTIEQKAEYSPYLERICSPQTRHHNEIDGFGKSERFVSKDRTSNSLVSRSGKQSFSKTGQGISIALRAHNAVASLTRMWEALEIPHSERDYAYSQLNRSSTLTVEYQKRMHTLLEYRRFFRDLLQERIICKNEISALLDSGKGSRKVLTELLTKFKVLTIQLSSLANACRFLCDKPICLPNIKILDKAEDSWFMYIKQECFYTRKTTALVFAILKFMPEMTLPEIQEVVNIFYDQCINCDETGDLFDLHDQKPPQNKADQELPDNNSIYDSTMRVPSLSDEDVSLYFLLGLQADAVFAGDDLPVCWDAHLHALKGCYINPVDLPVPLLTPQQLLDAITAEQDTLSDFNTILKFVNEQRKTLVIIPVYPTSDDWEAYQVDEHTHPENSMTLFKSYCQPLPELCYGDADKNMHPVIEPNYVSKSIVGYSVTTRSNTKPVLFAREEEPMSTKENSLPMPLKKITPKDEEPELMGSGTSDKAIYDENGQVLNTTYHMPATPKTETATIAESELYGAEERAKTPSERTDEKYVYNRYEVIETVTTIERTRNEPPTLTAEQYEESYQRAATPHNEESAEEEPAAPAPPAPVADEESYQRAATPHNEESAEEEPAAPAPPAPVADEESYQRAATPHNEESAEEEPAAPAPPANSSTIHQQPLPMPPYYTKDLNYDIEPNGADYDLPIEDSSLWVPYTVYIEPEVIEYAEPVAEDSINLHDASHHIIDE